MNLIQHKNVSCILSPNDLDYTISNYRNSDGSSALRVAEPPILKLLLRFFWFAHGSPYAKKFLQILRRVEETNLMNLVYKNPHVLVVDEFKTQLNNSAVKTEQLLTIA